MKKYKVFTIKPKMLQGVEEVAEEVSKLLNEKTAAGWEVVDISFVGTSTALSGYIIFITMRM